MAQFLWTSFVVSCLLCYEEAFAVFCSTRSLRIKNGDFTLRSGNSVAQFTCDQGFTLLGSDQIICFGSDWSSDPPICISNTCPAISESPTLRITKDYNGAMLRFSCTVMHKIEGKDRLVCQGTQWSDDPPICKVWDPPRSCDFEDPGLCGWSHHDEDEQEWRWNTGATKTTRTGPDHDHTYGDKSAGHYMYFETSSPTRTGHQAWLSSPLYPISYSGDYCFQFWYHSLGAGAMGTLEAFIKPESANLTDMTAMFYQNLSVGNDWQRELIPIKKQSEPYKIFFVATRGTGYRSDFAIDDVMLQKCDEFRASPSTTLMSTALPTKSTTMVSTAVNTNATSPLLPTTMRVTSAKPSSSTTLKPKSSVTTVKSSPVTSSVSSLKTKGTTGKVPNRKTKPIKKSTILPPNSQNPTKRTKLTSFQSNPTTENQQTTITTQGQGRKQVNSSGGSDLSTSNVTYIVVVVGICLCVLVGIGIGVFIYRRRRNKYVWSKNDSFSADNPLYRVVNSDDSAVQFANLKDD